MNKQEIRKLIANVYTDLKKNYKHLSENNFEEVYYDVGFMVALCKSINKSKLGMKIYERFM
jgi:hypothetical protein